MRLTVLLVIEEELYRRDRDRDRTVDDADNGVRVDAATESCDGCHSAVHVARSVGPLEAIENSVSAVGVLCELWGLDGVTERILAERLLYLYAHANYVWTSRIAARWRCRVLSIDIMALFRFIFRLPVIKIFRSCSISHVLATSVQIL
jgi:hypothetical protein